MNDFMACIEVLIQWTVGIIKWSVITAVVFSIITLALVGLLHILKANNIKLPKIEL